MQCFEIAFSGELVEGARVEVVKANLAKLFQADEQRIALLFSGRRVVIKSGLDAAGAEKYRMTLERAGARVEVCDLSAEVEENRAGRTAARCTACRRACGSSGTPAGDAA